MICFIIEKLKIMKKLFILFICLICACNIFGQDNVNKIKVQYWDEEIKRCCGSNDSIETNIVYIVNGVPVDEKLFSAYNPKEIESIDVLKDTINNLSNQTTINIKLKNENYKPKAITLKDLKNKHTKIKNQPVIFFVNRNLIKKSEEEYLIDENSILQIVVEKMQNPKDNSDLWILRIATNKDDIRIRF
jgi:hypothetical protein